MPVNRIKVGSFVAGGMSRAEADTRYVGADELAQEVTDAIAADSTVTDAAATAVDAEVTSRDLIGGTDTRVSQTAYSDDLAYAITDEAGRASWLAIMIDGDVPDHSREAIGYTDDARPANDGESFVITDEDGNTSVFALDESGDLAQRTIDHIAARIAPGGIVTAPTGLTTVGDSITAGVNTDVKWSQLAADLVGLPAWNPSVSGEASADIATRSGALQPLLTVSGDSLPTSTTPVSVTAVSPSDGWRIGMANGAVGVYTGVLCGIAGTLSRDNAGAWTFTRTTAGTEAVECPPGSPFSTQTGKSHRADIWTIWAGRNNVNQTQVLRDTATIVGFLQSDRYLVFSILNNALEPSGSAGYTTVLAVNAALAAAYPDNYYDMRAYLVNDAMTDLGLTPTAQDTTDMANDIYPESIRSDDWHPNRFGALAIGRKVADLIEQKGWATR